MAAPKKPGNPWNQFPKKKAPGKLSTRTPKPTVNPSRAVGAGGPPSAPPNRGAGGGGNGRGGSIVKASGNGANTSTRVKPVNVRDVTGQPRGQVAGSTNKGSLGTPKPPARLPGGLPKPALPKGAASTGKAIGKGLLAKAVVPADIAITANSVFNPNSEGNQQLAKALAAVNQRYAGKSGPRFKNPGSGSVTSKGAKPTAPLPKGSGDALREKSYASLQKFQVPATKTPDVPKRTPAASAPARSSNTSSGSSRPSIRAAAAAKKAEPGQSNDMNENYRIWAAKYGKLADKVKKGQAGYNAFAKDAVAGVGPVKDGSSYKPQAEKTSEMNASAVRRAALSASAGSVTDSDIALLDNKKKKKVNG
jgi:hypothetical protein